MTTEPNQCSIDDCHKPATRRGWCGKHYNRWRRHGDPTAYFPNKINTCTITGCDNPHEAYGWCSMHYQRWKNHGDPEYNPPKPQCQIDGCERKHKTRGYCTYHWYRLKKYGDPHWQRTYRHEQLTDQPSEPNPKTGLDFKTNVPREITPELATIFKQLPARLRNKIDYRDGCWEWTACRDKHGYGRASRGKAGGHKIAGAHRLIYELTIQDPGTNSIDHLCRNPACVRPDHLEAVPQRENLKRGRASNHSGYCRSGRHEWTEANIMTDGGYQRCRPCREEHERNRHRPIKTQEIA